MAIRYFTSEFVSPGHPDKICDQISDAVLDACLKDDENSRVACETFATTGFVLVGGEITTKTYIDIQTLVRDKIRETSLKWFGQVQRRLAMAHEEKFFHVGSWPTRGKG